jgi:hypothetical protein
MTARLGRGGPFLALLRRAKVLHEDGHEVYDAARLSLVMIAVGWVPLILLAPFSRGSAGLLTDFSVHARLLLSIPLLLEGDVLLHKLIAVASERFAEETLADTQEPGSVAGVQRRAEVLRGSVVAELVCLAFALLVGQLGLWSSTANPLSIEGLANPPVSPTTIWYGFVAQPAFLFLFYRSLWRWVVWCWMLARFSRMKLRLVPTHPDLSGGLGLLAIPLRGFALALLAVAAGVAGAWGTQIAFRGVSVRTFGPTLALLVGIALIVGLGPLLVFSGKLIRAKLLARIQYGSLARAYTGEFDERWIVHHQKEGLLGTADIQSLADMVSSYEVVRKMRIAPFDLYDVLLVVVPVLLPTCPLILTEIPLRTLLPKLVSSLL